MITFYTFVVLCLLEWKLGVLRWLITSAQHTFERYAAPALTVSRPPLAFTDDAAPSQLTPKSAGPNKIQCYDKGTNVPIGTVPVFDTEMVATTVAKAREAQKQWAKSSFATRRKFLHMLMDYILANQTEICLSSAIEGGKTLVDGTFGEILTTLEKLRWTIAQGEDVMAEEVREVGLMTIHKRASVTYHPIGVVGAIISWNYPFHNIMGPMISALFAGNAFVGKVSEYSSFYPSCWYEKMCREALTALGYSPHLVNFVTGYAETGQAVIDTVDKVTFIGSPGVGKLVMGRAAHTLTPVVLELGGKDPLIVCNDVDLNQVIPVLMRGTFQNCGQNCCGVERALIHAAIYDKVVATLTKKVEAMTQGPTTADKTMESVYDLGAMTMGRVQIEKIQRLLDESARQGARILVGGKARTDRFFPATLIVDVDPSMPIAREEVFGPILCVMKFRTDQEAIDIVNQCPYGLGSNVFSNDIARAQFIADRLDAGMSNINDFAINYLCQSLPFGGCKISGFDRFAGKEGLRGNCLVRANTRDRIPQLKTSVPPLLQYPIDKNSFYFCCMLANVLYAPMLTCVLCVFKLVGIKPSNKK